MDIVNKMLDLHKQATTEKSHYYVASVLKEALEEILRLRQSEAELRLAVLRGIQIGGGYCPN